MNKLIPQTSNFTPTEENFIKWDKIQLDLQTTFGKEGQTQCYDNDFYNNRKFKITDNRFRSLIDSVDTYNSQVGGVSSIDSIIEYNSNKINKISK